MSFEFIFFFQFIFSFFLISLLLKTKQNRFNLVVYENFVDPYFETICFLNEDGWWPGCEVLGDGQKIQDKNSSFYY